jgi:hypothetical protein
MDKDLDEIADQNDPYGNEGTRDRRGGKRGTGAKILNTKKPKWKHQLRKYKIDRKKIIK